MVDEVLASYYPSVDQDLFASVDHDLVHLAMMPIRWFPEVIEWIFGVNNGFQVYIKTAKDFGGCLMAQTL